MLKAIRSFLAKCQKIDPKPFGDDVEAELSIGFTVGDSIQFVASVDFSPSELRDLATLGIALSINAYPTSDEVNDPAKTRRWRATRTANRSDRPVSVVRLTSSASSVLLRVERAQAESEYRHAKR